MNSLINRIIGYILILPAILSVVEFFLIIIFEISIFKIFELAPIWYGYADFSNGGGAGFSSPLPLYLGLMAIAGAIILKENKK